VMNVNQLANALKPVVLPGETMRVFILREGKEYNQELPISTMEPWWWWMARAKW